MDSKTLKLIQDLKNEVNDGLQIIDLVFEASNINRILNELRQIAIIQYNINVKQDQAPEQAPEQNKKEE